MNAEGATPTSLGFGVERLIEKSRSASDAHEKVEHLTCALETLLMHLKFLEGEARVARDATARVSLDVELERVSSFVRSCLADVVSAALQTGRRGPESRAGVLRAERESSVAALYLREDLRRRYGPKREIKIFEDLPLKESFLPEEQS